MKVFISYKWEDPDHNLWVERLASDLCDRGIEALLDQWEVRLGESFSDYMTRGINTSDAVLFIMTPDSVRAAEASARGAVKFEMQLTTARHLAEDNFRFIGILRRGDRPAAHLRDFRYADFRDDTSYETRLRELVADLKGYRKKPPVGVEPSRPSYPLAESQAAHIRKDKMRRFNSAPAAAVGASPQPSPAPPPPTPIAPLQEQARELYHRNIGTSAAAGNPLSVPLPPHHYYSQPVVVLDSSPASALSAVSILRWSAVILGLTVALIAVLGFRLRSQLYDQRELTDVLLSDLRIAESWDSPAELLEVKNSTKLLSTQPEIGSIDNMLEVSESTSRNSKHRLTAEAPEDRYMVSRRLMTGNFWPARLTGKGYYLSVEARQKSGPATTAACLIFRADSAFCLSRQGYALVSRLPNQSFRWQRLKNWSPLTNLRSSTAIPNKLTVVSHMNSLLFFVNNNKVYQAPSSSSDLPLEQVGLGIFFENHGASVSDFEKIEVR